MHWYSGLIMPLFAARALPVKEKIPMPSLDLPIPLLNSSTIKSPPIWRCVLIRMPPQKGILILPTTKPTARKHLKILSLAVPDIKRIIEDCNIPVIAIDGYEADDVIGALAKQAEKAGYEVYMVTPDKDYGQLVSENIKIYKPALPGR